MDKYNYHPVIFEENIQRETELLKDNRSTKYIKEEIMELLNNDIISSLNNIKQPNKSNISTNNISTNNTITKGVRTRVAMRGLYEETLLSDLFFSNININNVQKLIKYEVYNITELYIDKQPENDLLDIMKSVYLQYKEHPKIPKNDDEKNELKEDYKKEIDKLNKIVVDISVPIILSYIKQHLAYLRDIQTPMFTERLNKATREERLLRSTTQVLGAEY